MRKVYLLALSVLVVLFLTGCTDLVQYDKGYHVFDGTSVRPSAQDMETLEAAPIHEDEETYIEDVETGDEYLAENTQG